MDYVCVLGWTIFLCKDGLCLCARMGYVSVLGWAKFVGHVARGDWRAPLWDAVGWHGLLSCSQDMFVPCLCAGLKGAAVGWDRSVSLEGGCFSPLRS